MSRASAGLKDLFFQGDYQQVLAHSWDSARPHWRIHDLVYILASLSFLGRTEEAETFLRSELARLTREQIIASRFFLGLGFTRQGNYAKARALFIANRRERGRITPIAMFYVHQGLSFYRYFCGKWRLAERDSARALEAAVRSRFLFGRALASDLRGHLLIQTGPIGRGLLLLREAQASATQINSANLARAFEISRVFYEAQYGLAPHETMGRLNKYIEAAGKQQDTYSLSNLLLELGRQLVLRGQFREAGEVLGRAAQQIYAHQNHRQELTLNLRYAYLSYISGDVPRGLSFLQSAKRGLDPQVDHVLRLSTLGLEELFAGALNLPDKQSELRRELIVQSQFYGGRVNRNILARWRGRDSSEGRETSAPSQDVVGDIKDLLVTQPERAIDRILETGYLGLLLELYPQFRGRQVLGVGLEVDGLISFSVSGVERQRGLTPLLRAVLQELSRGACTKAGLIQSVWKHRAYHPLHHDALIYQAITALRKLLGGRADWIETTEDGYRLRADVEIFSFAPQPQLHVQVLVQPQVTASSKAEAPLNHRQIQFLRQLKSQAFVNVGDYKKLFGVSEITASRDLSFLHKQGLVLKVGKARATRYARVGEKS